MDSIMEFISPELLVLIPVLYFVGLAIKNSATVADKFIPLILGGVGVLLAVVYTFATTLIGNFSEGLLAAFVGITQGVLCAGCSVYVNQLIKQNGKDDVQ